MSDSDEIKDWLKSWRQCRKEEREGLMKQQFGKITDVSFLSLAKEQQLEQIESFLSNYNSSISPEDFLSWYFELLKNPLDLTWLNLIMNEMVFFLREQNTTFSDLDESEKYSLTSEYLINNLGQASDEHINQIINEFNDLDPYIPYFSLL